MHSHSSLRNHGALILILFLLFLWAKKEVWTERIWKEACSAEWISQSLSIEIVFLPIFYSIFSEISENLYRRFLFYTIRFLLAYEMIPAPILPWYLWTTIFPSILPLCKPLISHHSIQSLSSGKHSHFFDALQSSIILIYCSYHEIIFYFFPNNYTWVFWCLKGLS